MRFYLLVISLVYNSTVNGQDTIQEIEGIITFKSTMNYYVKFIQTDYIQIGDTLLSVNSDSKGMLVVNNKSSTSCICSKITDDILSVGDHVKIRVIVPKFVPKLKERLASNQVTDSTPSTKKIVKQQIVEKSITGRISLSAYSTLIGQHQTLSNRMRYTVVLNTNKLFGGKWSAESYVSIRHKVGDKELLKTSLFNAVKIYSLALKYIINEKEQVWIGRKINQHVSNIGAVDGFQYERFIGKINFGVMVGSRPDYTDYSINLKLMQAGLFGSHTFKNNKGLDMVNTLAFFEQQNDFKTDRRFAYIQHSNNLMKNLSIFSSIEINLFKKTESRSEAIFEPASVYVSMRYKINKKLVISTSYDALKNIIYYESYKNFIDQLIEREVRQGFRIGSYFDPWRGISLGINGGYRFQSNGRDPSKNADIYLSTYELPLIKASLTANITYLDTDYLNGLLWGTRLNKSFFKDRLSIESAYRRVNYGYSGEETPLKQNIMELGFNFRVSRKMGVSMNVETTFKSEQKYSTIYLNVIKRF